MNKKAEDGVATCRPIVSVVLPVFNDQCYIARAVASILSQTLHNIELIVVNDGSSDNTAPVLRKIKDPRLQVINQSNKGIANSLNMAVSLSKAEFIARMDSDDIASPERLKQQLDFLVTHPEIGMAGSCCDITTEEGTLIKRMNVPLTDEKIRRHIIWENPFVHSSVMIRKEVFKSVGPYRLKFWEDYELWWRVIQRYKVANLKERLMIRTHRGEATTRIDKSKHYWYKLKIQLMAIRYCYFSLSIYLSCLRTATCSILHWLIERLPGKK